MRLSDVFNEIAEAMNPENWSLIEHIKFWIIKKIERKF